MKKLLLTFLACYGGGFAFCQSLSDHEMGSIDSLILAKHHYDSRVVKVDTAYYLHSKKISEHYFIDTSTHVLERAVVQVYHSPTRSTIEYYFFLNNALARVQSQDYREEQFSEAEIYYFHNNVPIDSKKKDKRVCDSYVQKAKGLVSRLMQPRS
jgi:hypothetical protein